MLGKNNNLKPKKIVLTGGHAATTALAVVEELIRRNQIDPSWDIYWIGAKKAIEGKNIPTLESQIFPKIGISHHHIIAGRIQRNFTIWTIPSLAKIPFGFLHALQILLKIKPNVILSFGGYAAFPVVIVGRIMNIPVVIHDQTSVFGRANRFSAPFAQKIALARNESKKYLNNKKVVVVGNPILTQIAEIGAKNKPGIPPTLYISCGSRGSIAINNLIEEIINDLLKKFIVIHQTGFLDYEKIKKVRSDLPKNLRDRYEIYISIDPMQLDGVYKRADIIIARAGANTVSEIISTKRPAILIPLPFAYQDEQLKNAQIAEKLGIAKVLKQDELTPDKLLSEINNIYRNWRKIVSKAKDGDINDKSAAGKLVNLLKEVC